MPATAQWVQQRRKEWGDAWVKECQKRALAGEPGWFYAIERGYTIGTPYDHREPGFLDWQQYAILAGCDGAWFMRAPTICGNCDTALPEGCGGKFRGDGAACRLNPEDGNDGAA